MTLDGHVNIELSFSRRCPDEAFARYVANALKQDELKTGSIETSGDD